MKNLELTKLMYELYDREFDIQETLEVIQLLTDLRQLNKTKNRAILNHGEDSKQAKRWRDLEEECYKYCEEAFKKYKLEYKPYKII